jgi:hypothetical protein
MLISILPDKSFPLTTASALNKYTKFYIIRNLLRAERNCAHVIWTVGWSFLQRTLSLLLYLPSPDSSGKPP